VGRSAPSQALLTTALALVSTAFALVLGEGLVRAFGLAPGMERILLDEPESRLQVSENPLQAYELKPHYQSAPHLGFRTNSHGLRGPERAIPSLPGSSGSRCSATRWSRG
jgi:hypothetical protein